MCKKLKNTMKNLMVVMALALSLLKVNAQEPPVYTAEAAYNLINTINPVPFSHTTHPDAQWFPAAGMGLFMHWGIHSVAGAQPSWDMIAHYIW